MLVVATTGSFVASNATIARIAIIVNVDPMALTIGSGAARTAQQGRECNR